MPALPPVAKTLAIHLFNTLQDDLDVVNRFYVTYSGLAPNAGQLDTLAAAIGSAWGARMSSQQHPNIVLDRVEVTDLSSPTSAVGSASVSQPGTKSGSTLSAAATLVFNMLIDRRYRGSKPKMFVWAGVETDLQTVGTWKTAFVTAASSAFNLFIGDVLAAVWSGGGTLTQSNVSYYEGFTPVTNPTTGRVRNVPKLRVTPLVDQVIVAVGDTRIGSQRRRNQ